MSDFIEGLRAQASEAAFPMEGELSVPGLHQAVTIRRDAWGVPVIDAGSLDDLWFAQGLVTAGERLFQLDLALRVATGRLSEAIGERSFEADRFIRTIGLPVAGRRYLESWSEEDHAMHRRFREGVHAWVDAMPARPIEYRLLDLTPGIPDDPAVWAAGFAYLAWGLSNNHEQELLRTRIAERTDDETAMRLLPPVSGGNGRGSNAWVVAGSRTASGAPLLANDPHLLALQPGAWFEVHLRAPDLEVRGVALTFTPGVILGATPHHAWGATNVTGDVQDLVEVGDDDVARVRVEEISVRGEAEPRRVEVRETRYGPVLETVPLGMLAPTYEPVARSYALHWTGHDHGMRPTLALEAARARDFEAFRGAALGVGCPGQNFVYADVDGTIGYQCTGRHPVRGDGDGLRPVTARTPAAEWTGWIAPGELPSACDPDDGFIVTANDGLHAATTTHVISNDFHQPYRARRIVELLAEGDAHDVSAMASIQSDTVSLPARETLPLLMRVEPTTEAQRDALAELAAWDGDMAAGSAPAALFNAWCAAIARRVLIPRLGDALTGAYLAWRESFQCVVLPALLRERPDGWLDDGLLRAALAEAIDDVGGRTWGELHRLRLAHPLASISGLEGLFVAADLPWGGDEQTVSQAGIDGTQGFATAVIASWRVVYDLGDLDRSRGVLPTGNSGNPASPHWADQVDRYAAGELRPLAFSPGAIEAATVATLSIVPGPPVP
jgi:penicillin amidase